MQADLDTGVLGILLSSLRDEHADVWSNSLCLKDQVSPHSHWG